MTKAEFWKAFRSESKSWQTDNEKSQMLWTAMQDYIEELENRPASIEINPDVKHHIETMLACFMDGLVIAISQHVQLTLARSEGEVRIYGDKR